MKKDVTRMAVERAAGRLRVLREELKGKFFTGPNRVTFTPQEFRRAFDKADQTNRELMMKNLSDEDLARVMLAGRRLSNGKER